MEPGPQETPARAEIRQDLRALRQDWEIPPERKTRIIQRLVDLVDPPGTDGPDQRPVPRRTALAAAKVLGVLGKLSIEQQRADTQRLAAEAKAHPEPAKPPSLVDQLYAFHASGEYARSLAERRERDDREAADWIERHRADQADDEQRERQLRALAARQREAQP